MLTDYLIITLAVSAATLLWRTIKDDYPRFKKFIRDLPYVGESLSCGVCTSFWFAFPVVIAANPFGMWQPPLYPALFSLSGISVFFAGWFGVGVGVLFFRSAVIVLLELAAILKHKHVTTHQPH